MLKNLPFHLVLGSQSPRRKEILSTFQIPFTIATSYFDEESVPFSGDPICHALLLSKGKADALYPQFPTSYILTADTVVYREGRMYGKPQNLTQAFQWLTELSGNWHSVFTAVTLRHQNNYYQQCPETRILFNPLSPKQIESYLNAIQWDDKAGGYTIQKAGNLVVNRIEGCYYNVIGLPVNAVRHVLNQVGVELWDYV